MKTRLWLAATLCGIATSAYSLTIQPTFDSSITGDPNGAAMMTAINAAIQVLQSNLTDNVTVNITFVADENVGLGQSSTYGGEYSYADFLAALHNKSTSVNDALALGRLPNSPTDPVIGGTQIHLTTAQARLLGLDGYNGQDSTVSLKMSLMNLTRPPADPNKYDLQQVVEHEMDEVLGISSGLPGTSVVWPVDLFRYTTNRVRTFTTTGDDAYFCVDGTNLLARYNMDPGGDYGDWWSTHYPTNWSPTTGLTLNYPQVQDAFSGPNTAKNLGVAELTALDVVGWTLATPVAPLALTMVRTSANHYTISWPNSYTGYVLQENTNLLDSTGWVDSSSGTANPAVLVSTTGQKFYRLFQRPNSIVLSAAPAPHPSTTIAHEAVTRVLRPRNP